MSSLSKLAVQIALEAAGGSTPDFLVFCSQHGDLTRLREMLRSIATGVELSPTAFSQSVHNASAGLYTIVAHSRAPVSSLASGGSTFASGWLEAEGYLIEHPEAQVLLVCYDEPLPQEYAPVLDADPVPIRARLAAARRRRTRARAPTPAPAEQDEPLPLAPLFIAWALSSEPTMRITADGQGWIWSRASAQRRVFQSGALPCFAARLGDSLPPRFGGHCGKTRSHVSARYVYLGENGDRPLRCTLQGELCKEIRCE